MTFTDPGDAVVAEALTRTCGMCLKPKGVGCVCIVHSPPHQLASCDTASGRIVHFVREKPKPKGGD